MFDENISKKDIKKVMKQIEKRDKLIKAVLKSPEFEKRVREIAGTMQPFHYVPMRSPKDEIYGPGWGKGTAIPATIKFKPIITSDDPSLVTSDDPNKFVTTSVSMQNLVPERQESIENIIHNERMDSMQTPMS